MINCGSVARRGGEGSDSYRQSQWCVDQIIRDIFAEKFAQPVVRRGWVAGRGGEGVGVGGRRRGEDEGVKVEEGASRIFK